DVVTDLVGEEGERDPEPTAEDVPEVREVLAEQALVGVDAEGDLERVQRLRIDAAPVVGHHRQRRVARHEARDEEVQRDRRPEGDHEEPHPAEDEPQDPRLMSENCASGRHPLGFRWRSMTPQSGTSYAAGFAKAFFFVTQPARWDVLYWYQ